MESDYLFDPPLPRWPSPKPVESAQTRQDATDVLFQPSLVRLGNTACTAAVVAVIIPKAETENDNGNDGVVVESATVGDTARKFKKGRRATGRRGRDPKEERQPPDEPNYSTEEGV